MAETRITLEETNDFATALRVRRLAIGMDLATLRGFLAPSKLFVPTTQKAYETFVDEFIVDELPLCTYQVLLGMLSSRLGIPLATLGGGRLN